ncbi:MAG: Caspase domain-containing protein [Leptolyngbyaceae cyanobacterium MO_188.B28]|nr:Caspase domain-containing protein [Leptolyngbyaceae cyanobacterium MO_188.B28]
MHHRTLALGLFLGTAVWSAAVGATFSTLEVGIPASLRPEVERASQLPFPTVQSQSDPTFLLVAGGGAPYYNEIALEKNVLYFQRTLETLGFNPDNASIFFANGDDGRSTVRYLDEQGRERFKPPEIPNLLGAATLTNFQRWFQQAANQPLRPSQNCPVFFYFTGHGAFNGQDEDNNSLILWNESLVSVRQLADQLDQLPTGQPVVTMMAQCYAGSFANLIYQGGDPNQPLAPQTRCGFFATVSSRPSVGCTPAVNEADYRDYSSSFFAGLSGRDRVGQSVNSADYNQDGQISYAEAHAFSKVDERTSDWPISTSEAWLQRRVSPVNRFKILRRPLSDLTTTARPEQKFVVDSIAEILQFDLEQSFQQNKQRLSGLLLMEAEIQEAYLMRLEMELLNIGMEDTLRERNNSDAIAILERLLTCEAGRW